MKYALLAVVALMSCGAAFADEARQEFLGEVHMRNFGDTDAVEFRGACPSPENRPVEAVQLRVYRKGVEVEKFVVEFQNGQREHFPVRERFARDTESRWLPLNGVRCIRSFKLEGHAEGYPENEHAIVQVWGLRHHRW